MAAGSASHTGGLIKASFLKSGKEFTQKYFSQHVYDVVSDLMLNAVAMYAKF